MAKATTATSTAAKKFTLSIADAMQTDHDNDDIVKKSVDSIDSKSTFEFISSANEGKNLEQRLDKVAINNIDSGSGISRKPIISKFVSSTSSSSSSSSDSEYCNRQANERAKCIVRETLLDIQSTTKNKRKNFKPRSTTVTPVEQPLQFADGITILNLMMQNSIKQQNQQQQRLEHDRNHQNVYGMPTTLTTSALAKCTPNANEVSFFLDNSDLTVSRSFMKSPPSSPSYSVQSQNSPSASLCRDDNTNDHNSNVLINSASHSFTNRHHYHQQQHHLNASPAKHDFTNNAYNAVQELLTVYGLSISPSDIVDAFSKKSEPATSIRDLTNSALLKKGTNQLSKTQQHALVPPTPPRTPITTPSTASSSVTPTSGSSSSSCSNANSTISPSNELKIDENTDSAADDASLSTNPYATFLSKQIASIVTHQLMDKNKNNNNSSPIDAINNRILIENLRRTDSDCVNESKAIKVTLDGPKNRKRKLEVGMGVSNKRQNIEQQTKNADHEHNSSGNDCIDDVGGGRGGEKNVCDSEADDDKSSYSEGNFSVGQESYLSTKNRTRDRSGTFDMGENDTSIDSVVSTLLHENQKKLGVAQSLSSNVDNAGLNLTKDKYFEKPSMTFLPPAMKVVTVQGDENKLIDPGKYLSKYSSFVECNHERCAADKLREHFHCLDMLCLGVNKVLCKREEVLRHLKWHKKRNESLTHGFLRFSSTDDCSIQFDLCQHNGKQTHYHCLQPNCDKVYISTSDVQMHSNYHRKDSAIMQEGFQRFRATEECNADFCIFAGQRTTHFHCIRDNCNYTFKNKAEMEKHKTYHIKDELLARDGFKKFLKTEPCSFDRCRFSLQCNHIHCVRESCFYVLHSSGQLLSHKRKHERLDSEQAYQQFKLSQKMDLLSNESADVADLASLTAAAVPTSSTATVFKTAPRYPAACLSSILSNYTESDSKGESLLSSESLEILQQMHFQKQALMQSQAKAAATKMDNSDEIDDDDDGEQSSLDNNDHQIDSGTPKTFIGRSLTTAELEQMKQIYSASENAKQKQINALLFAQNNFNDDQAEPLDLNLKKLTKQNNADSLLHSVAANTSFKDIQISPSNLQQITSIDGLFNRKRGRPPKNRVVEVYQNAQSQTQQPQAIFTSFKLEKNGKSSPLPPDTIFQSKMLVSQLLVEDQLDANIFNTSKNELVKDNLAAQSGSVNRSQDSEVSNNPTAERKRRLSFTSSPSNDNEKVSIVRAAGTFFPQNYENGTTVNVNRKTKEIASNAADDSALQRRCNVSACELPNDGHIHCDDCTETFYHSLQLMAHSVKHKTTPNVTSDTKQDSVNKNISDSPNELMQHFAKFIAKQSENLFNTDNPFNYTQPSTIPNISVLTQHRMGVNNKNYSFNEQLLAQIQTMCLAQLSSLYQHNPMMHQHLYPLLGAIDQLKPDSSQVFLPSTLDVNALHLTDLNFVNPFVASSAAAAAAAAAASASSFDLSKNQQSKKIGVKLQRQNQKLLKPETKTKSIGDAPLNRSSGGGNFKIFKDEPIPKGYLKFRFNEDCNFSNCGYSNLQSHFHCCRTDCYYSFCDKTRFVQHTARHERLDKLMGDDFKQYRANMSCRYDDCVYKNNLGANNKSSHFHCLKCKFICSDTNKVVAHRRHHSKMEYIRKAGFRKVANNEHCTSIQSKKQQSSDDDEDAGNDSDRGDGEETSAKNLNDGTNAECSYSMKQTHYHCLVCDCCVLSRAQLSSHRHRTN